MKLDKLYVDPAAAAPGHRCPLIEHVSAAVRCRLQALILAVNKRNERAIAAYRRHGFAVRESVCVDIGHGFVMDDFIMAKSLLAPPQSPTRMRLPFVKMHGLGNDFVVLDGVRQSVELLTPSNCAFLADRHFGVGCDQILLVERAEQPGSISAIGSSMPMAARSNSAATARAASSASFMSRA
jgi:hypothetical protein